MTKKIFDGAVIQYCFFIISTTIIDTIVGTIMALFLRKKIKKINL